MVESGFPLPQTALWCVTHGSSVRDKPDASGEVAGPDGDSSFFCDIYPRLLSGAMDARSLVAGRALRDGEVLEVVDELGGCVVVAASMSLMG